MDNPTINSESRVTPPFPWVVPLVLLCGISASLYFHLPLYVGLIVAYAGSLTYALVLRHSVAQSAKASLRGMKTMVKVCVILLCIGAVVALWMDAGVIPYMTVLGAAYVSGHNILWISFLLATILSMIIGSSIATWSVLGPPLLALAPVSLAPLLAGALVSGGMVGDRSSPMSSSAVLMSSVTGVTHSRTLRQLLTTAVIPSLLTGIAFWALNLALHPSIPSLQLNAQKALGSMILPLLLIIFACCRVPLLYNLSAAIVLGLSYSIFAEHHPVVAVLSSMWHGVPSVLAGTAHDIGGVQPMLSAVLLIFAAGAFQGVTALGGSVEALTKNVLARIQHPVLFTCAAYGMGAVFALVMGSQMLSILMTTNTLAPQFDRRQLPKEALLQVVSDGAELFPCIIPWNLLGLQSAVIFHIPTFVMAPYAWYIYISLAYSMFLFAHRVKAPQNMSGMFSVLTR